MFVRSNFITSLWLWIALLFRSYLAVWRSTCFIFTVSCFTVCSVYLIQVQVCLILFAIPIICNTVLYITSTTLWMWWKFSRGRRILKMRSLTLTYFVVIQTSSVDQLSVKPRRENFQGMKLFGNSFLASCKLDYIKCSYTETMNIICCSQ